jgi:hypothetical protein
MQCFYYPAFSQQLFSGDEYVPCALLWFRLGRIVQKHLELLHVVYGGLPLSSSTNEGLLALLVV